MTKRVTTDDPHPDSFQKLVKRLRGSQTIPSKLTAEDRELVERLRTATYQVVHSYKNYSIKPDEQKRAAAALIMRLSGEKFGPPKYRDDAKE